MVPQKVVLLEMHLVGQKVGWLVDLMVEMSECQLVVSTG